MTAHPQITQFDFGTFNKYEQVIIHADKMQAVANGLISLRRINGWPWRLMQQTNVDRLHEDKQHIYVQLGYGGFTSHKLVLQTAISIGVTPYLLFGHRDSSLPGCLVRGIADGAMVLRLFPELVSATDLAVHVQYALSGQTFMPPILFKTDTRVRIFEVSGEVRDYMVAGGMSCFTQVKFVFNGSDAPLGSTRVIWSPRMHTPAGSYGPLRRFLFKQPRVKNLEYYLLRPR